MGYGHPESSVRFKYGVTAVTIELFLPFFHCRLIHRLVVSVEFSRFIPNPAGNSHECSQSAKQADDEADLGVINRNLYWV